MIKKSVWGGLFSFVLIIGSGQALANSSDNKIPASVLALAQQGAINVVAQMQGQADLSAAAAIRDKNAKGEFVTRQLRARASQTQAPLIALLQSLNIPYRSYWLADVVQFKADAAVLRQVAELPSVALIDAVSVADFSQPRAKQAKAEGDEEAGPESTIEPGLSLVRAPLVWELGIRGQGVVVGDHDIGVEWQHPALINQYRGWNGSEADHNYNWRNAFGALDLFCTDPAEPCDSHGHGTHTTGTMVGDDQAGHQIGMAPQAQWMACRSLLDPVVGVGTLPTYLDCMEWFVAPYPLGEPDLADPTLAPDVINNSWGCLEACTPTILQAANEAIKAAGIVQVVSAGNDGQGEGLSCSTLEFPPALYDSSFTVGASNYEDQMADFSSRGPVLSDLSMRTKPDIVAPGVSVISSSLDGSYASLSGTSMAGPHVAGLVALMISAEPRLRGQVDLIRDIIQSTAVPLSTTEACGGIGPEELPNNVFGYGRIDALAAVLAIPAMLDDEAVTEPQDDAEDAGNGPATTAQADINGRGGALWLSLLIVLSVSLIRRR